MESGTYYIFPSGVHNRFIEATKMTQSICNWFKILYKRLDVELTYDMASKEYGIRQVWRSRLKREDGWREYVGDKKAFVVPQHSLKRIIKEAEYFVRDRP